MDMSD